MYNGTGTTKLRLKPNIHRVIWSHAIQSVHYTIAQSYRIELLSIPYDSNKSYATKSQRV